MTTRNSQEGRLRVWLTGAAGLIAGELLRLAPEAARGAEVIPLRRSDLDLADAAAVEARFQRDQPDWVLHCAAMTRSPQCQAEPAEAWRQNVEVTERLAALAAERRLLFFSTDLVFDGTRGQYVERDAPNPLNRYGETKAAAEQAVLRHARHWVVRTSLNYGASRTGDRTFNEETVRLWREGRPMSLFVDEFRCPIPASATARAVWEVVRAVESGDARLPAVEGDATSRIVHVAGAQRMSRWEIGQALAARWAHLHPELRAGSLKEYRGGPRPADTSLDSSRVQSLLDWPLPRFAEWLAAQPPEARGAGA